MSNIYLERGLPSNIKNEILKRTLGDIICENTGITALHENVFDLRSSSVPCNITRGKDNSN